MVLAFRRRVSLDVAVIGAGAAGLVAAREALREGHRPVVFEQGERLGGVWVLDDRIERGPLNRDHDSAAQIHSSMYDSLRVNLPRELMSFADFPFTPEAMKGRSIDARRYPGHEEVLRYLEVFAEHFGLVNHIRFQTRVLRIRPLRATAASQPSPPSAHVPPQWEVTSCFNPSACCAGGGRPPAASERARTSGSVDDGAASSTAAARFDAVIVCNGHYSVPRVPPVEGLATYPGCCEHSHSYRRPEPYAGKSVLIVGAHASGEDIARDVALHATRVVMSAKTWMLAEYAHDARPFGPRRNVSRTPWLARLHADGTAEFEDGSRDGGFDIIMFCTGYHYSMPFLEPGLVDTSESHVRPVYQHLFHTDHGARLAFLGLPFKVVPFPQFELQARLAARVLSGRAALPPAEEQRRWAADLSRSFEVTGEPLRHVHQQGSLQFEYNDWLAQQCGDDTPVTPLWRKRLWEAAGRLKKEQGPDKYRDAWEDWEAVSAAGMAFRPMLLAINEPSDLKDAVHTTGQVCG